MSIDQCQLRFVEVKGIKYIRVEDVVQLLLDVSGTFETDDRWQLEQLAGSLRGKANANG